jgi:hypothetical protein
MTDCKSSAGLGHADDVQRYFGLACIARHTRQVNHGGGRMLIVKVASQIGLSVRPDCHSQDTRLAPRPRVARKPPHPREARM